MSEADLSDVVSQTKRDPDVYNLVQLLKKVLHKYGAFITTRIFAYALAPYKRARFEKMLGVSEDDDVLAFAGIPSDLTGKDYSDDIELENDMQLDHTILWQKQGEAQYLTSEPYYMTKEHVKNLIEHCDKYGIDFQIDAESCYYPGHAIRVIFKKRRLSQYDVMQQMAGERRYK